MPCGLEELDVAVFGVDTYYRHEFVFGAGLQASFWRGNTSCFFVLRKGYGHAFQRKKANIS
jgi:hypothetical protein